MSRTSVIGNFGYRSGKLDGQTVKTRLILQLVRQEDTSARHFDREDIRHNPLAILSMFALIARSEQIIYLPAYGHLKLVFPLIWLVASLFHTRIHYIVIGGWLADFIRPLPLHRFLLRRIESIMAETRIQKRELEERYGLKNVALLYNFRPGKAVQPSELQEPAPILRLVFMARVGKVKGIDMIFALADYLRRQGLEGKVAIDFYGQVETADLDYFYSEVAAHRCTVYRGVLQPREIQKTLRRYDAMLFPTQHAGEGLPGSLIDAYMAGLPVIATQWKYAEELIEPGQTGLVVPLRGGQDELNRAVVSLLSDRPRLLRMKRHAAAAGRLFEMDTARAVLKQHGIL